jgi:hypothetical protein
LSLETDIGMHILKSFQQIVPGFQVFRLVAAGFSMVPTRRMACRPLCGVPLNTVNTAHIIASFVTMEMEPTAAMRAINRMDIPFAAFTIKVIFQSSVV